MTQSLILRRDTVIERDSILVYVSGDTVTKESWKIRERVSLRRDTVYVVKTEKVSEPKIVPVEKEKKLKFPIWIVLAGIVGLSLTVHRLCRRRS